MTLGPGTRLGPYEITGPIGAGGMGEVYKARDTRLDRTVAIKVLPPHVLSDPSLRARFEREARTVSSLDHPNICIVHDVGREGDVEYIVMQYIEGETLAARLARGPLPLDEALRYGTEIAAALDRAHRAGILHRDLKPGNVMIAKVPGRDPSTRLLDFGLAKHVVTGSIDGAATVPPTASSPLTGQGSIVGTLLYMSPEQLEGREVDARSDIFSFGVVLYEMVTGRRAFDGSSQASIIGAILEREPPPIASIAPLTPPALDRVVRKCLAKDRDRRWQSAADLCDELSWIAQSTLAQSSGVQSQTAASSVSSGTAASPGRRRLPRFAVLALLLLAVVTAAVLAWIAARHFSTAPQPAPAFSRHVDISVPDDVRLARGGIAVSPDGQTIVFAARPAAPDGGPATVPVQAPRLYVRRFNSSSASPIAGTEGARTPFFSPDGTSVGYLTDRAMFTVSLQGGRPVRIIGVPPVSRGAVWLPDGSFLLSPTQSNGFMRVADGQVGPFTEPDLAQGDKAHIWPQLLPGRQHVLFTIRRGTALNPDDSDLAILDIATKKWRVLVKGAAFPQYSPTRHLFFVRGGTLSVTGYDPAQHVTSGPEVPLVERLAVDARDGGAHYVVGPDGTLLYLSGTFGAPRRSAVWVDRAGKATPVPGIAGNLAGHPRLSADDRRALFDAISPDGDDEIYIADLARGTAVRLSNDPRDDFSPIWTHDGRVIWTALLAGRLPLLVMNSAGGTRAEEELVHDPAAAQFVGSVSKDGVLAFRRATPGGASDIFTIALAGERKPRPLVATAAVEFSPEFFPDGQFVAYVSSEAGVMDVYVTPYPGPGVTQRVSSGGASSPAWSRDGRQLFFQSAQGMMAVDVTRGANALAFGTPRLLFAGDFVRASSEDSPRDYDPSSDGKRFLMMRGEAAPPAPLTLHVLFDWVADLKR